MKKYREHEADIKCPLCDSEMTYSTNNTTHMWSCKECSAILFEYYDGNNIDDIRVMIK